MSFPPTTMQKLTNGIEELGLSLANDSLMQYLLLLQKWNQTYNLTAIRDLDAMVSRHILDSLVITPWIKGTRVLDIGTGAGLPGIPLALANPDLQFVLLDSNGKKIHFLQEVRRHLQLPNVEIVQSRAENYRPSFDFDTVTSRAFSELTQMINWTQHLIDSHGIWLAMKGRYPETELANILLPYQVKSYKVPEVEGERCCVIIENAIKE